MENKQTAVMWLEEALAENLKEIIRNCNYRLIESLFEQAKAMEREQIEESYDKGSVDSGILSIGLNDYTSGSDYFTKKFQNGK